MKNSAYLTGLVLLLLASACMAQPTYDLNGDLPDSISRASPGKKFIWSKIENKWVSFAELGKCWILRKDKLKIKNVTIFEIHPTYLTYEKDGNLHDMALEKVKLVETDYRFRTGTYSEIYRYYELWFDEKGRPYFRKTEIK